MSFFDYIYYKVYQYGDKVGEMDSHAYTVIVVSVLQMVNLLSFLFLFQITGLLPQNIDNVALIILFYIIPLILNFYKYSRSSQD